MAKKTKKTPSFVVTLPLVTTPDVEKAILLKFEAARKVRNAVIGEGRVRLRLLKSTKAWKQATALHAAIEALKEDTTLTRDQKKERKKEYLCEQKALYKRAHQVLQEHYPTSIMRGAKKVKITRTLSDIQNGGAFLPWSSQFNYCPHISQHLESQAIRDQTATAQKGIMLHLYGDAGGGKWGMPKFKKFGTVCSVATLANTQGILWRGEDIRSSREPKTAGDGFQVVWKAGRGSPVLVIPAKIDRDDPVIDYSMKHRVKYCRVLVKKLNQQDRFFVQLVLEGVPLQVEPAEVPKVHRVLGPKGVIVGLDGGVSTVAVVSPYKAMLVELCKGMDNMAGQERRLQQKIARQERLNNPDNFEGKKRKRGVRLTWHNSKGFLRNRAKLADLQRRRAATRHSMHGALVNYILTLGDTFITEDIAIKQWAKKKKGRRFSFGKPISQHAPAAFFARLKLRVAQLHGNHLEVPTCTTALSQTCQCGAKVKKDLGKRWHRCPCGVEAQRDLYSAFLCMFVKDGQLDKEAARAAWPDVKPLLDRCVEDLREEKRNGESGPSSLGI